MLLVSEWNIDFSGENLGSHAREDSGIVSGEMAEMSYSGYGGELTYMYEPDVLNDIPTTSALYGSDPDVTLVSQVTSYPVVAATETEQPRSEPGPQAGARTWVEPHPDSPSHESIDSAPSQDSSAWESQVSTPQASPRRCEDEEDPQPAAFPAKSSSRAKPQVKSGKRKREVKPPPPVSTKPERTTKASRLLAGLREHRDNSPPESAMRSTQGKAGSTRPSVLSILPPHDDEDPRVAELLAKDPSTLTPEEARLLKKKKRLIKNRESAQLSRQRKRVRLETLQQEVLHLEEETKRLNDRIAALADENASLRKRLLAQQSKSTRAAAVAVH